MSYKKFESNDLVINTMRAHPKCEFFIFDGKVYYNDIPEQSGEFSSQVLNVPPGHVSLFEYNIDRANGTNPFIVPFIYKSGDKTKFKTMSDVQWSSLSMGAQLTSSYPLSASITREFMSGDKSSEITLGTSTITKPNFRHFFSLKNRLDFYGTLSEHYKVSSSLGNKFTQTLNLLSIPSIFYGDRIKPGTVDLKWYLTGSLIGQLKDEKHNGELIQVGPEGSTGSGSVAGVVLYNEGFILLTGSWALSSESINLTSGGPAKKPGWIYFGAGALDDVNTSTAGASYASASFNIKFDGSNDTQVMTMFAHARKGEVNYSNNPTFLQYNQDQISQTSSVSFIENSSRLIHNTVSSSYTGYDAEFKRQVYISRVAIYDENKNLLGIATLSNPVLKKEDEDLSFKIKLDI